MDLKEQTKVPQAPARLNDYLLIYKLNQQLHDYNANNNKNYFLGIRIALRLLLQCHQALMCSLSRPCTNFKPQKKQNLEKTKSFWEEIGTCSKRFCRNGSG